VNLRLKYARAKVSNPDFDTLFLRGETEIHIRYVGPMNAKHLFVGNDMKSQKFRNYSKIAVEKDKN